MSNFNFSIHYKPGIQNVAAAADSLSQYAHIQQPCESKILQGEWDNLQVHEDLRRSTKVDIYSVLTFIVVLREEYQLEFSIDETENQCKIFVVMCFY